jgi:hypothetical protein
MPLWRLLTRQYLKFPQKIKKVSMSKPQIHRWLAAAFCLCLPFLSCANKELSRPEGQRISEMPARLTVINQLHTSMQVYLRPEQSSEIYLGRISIGETKTFLLRPPFPPGRSVLVAAQTAPAWGGNPVVAELAESLTAGDTLKWDLLLNHLDWRARTATEN